jgi:phospholipid/cholesterol/gamma-HCH transport system permease protein
LTPGDLTQEPGSSVIHLSGQWTTPHLAELESRFARVAAPPGQPLTIDASGIAAMDTGGAWLLHEQLRRLKEQRKEVHLQDLSEEYRALLVLVEERLGEPPPVPQKSKRTHLLEALGRRAWVYVEESLDLLAFIGEAFLAGLRTLQHPARIRWAALMSNIERAGVQAIPIVALLSFLLGIVIAYQGGMQLKNYGANIFIVELVSLTMIRELAPIMTAIIIAGRTASAYTAEIGTMKVTEEIDALRTIGIAPMDILVLPKVFGLIIVLPLLTLIADASGILGGMVMSTLMLDVSFQDFIDRLPQVYLILSSFLIGIGKAPVFAIIVALMGCYQGFQVWGGADSVGRQTTVSVVQSIFLVIVADAVFSILFAWLGI